MSEAIIRIWKFAGAPEELRALAVGVEKPRWLMQIPQSLYAPDLDAEIRRRVGVEELTVVEAPGGDIVYIGAGDFAPLRQWLFEGADSLIKSDRP